MDLTRKQWFQLTRPRGARPRSKKWISRANSGFNSRAREGRDCRSRRCNSRAGSFNSRAREGRDSGQGGRGADRSRSFNSRAREGRDGSAKSSLAMMDLFQLTRPRGARPSAPWPWKYPTGFNSRAREGRDGGAVCPRLEIRVSTHAPARGATSSPVLIIGRRGFQLTRPRGARQQQSPQRKQGKQFQLTRPRGARREQRDGSLDLGVFQLTRPRGARRNLRISFASGSAFQLTRPRGARPP